MEYLVTIKTFGITQIYAYIKCNYHCYHHCHYYFTTNKMHAEQVEFARFQAFPHYLVTTSMIILIGPFPSHTSDVEHLYFVSALSLGFTNV